MDESSFAFGCICKTRVIGQAGNWVQHSQREGNLETATIMPLISAAGACMPPCVIFKGQQHCGQNQRTTHLNAHMYWILLMSSRGQMSEKGYSSQVIGQQWVESVFDPKTQDIANGCMHLLIVDGHSSHFTYELPHYATTHNIVGSETTKWSEVVEQVATGLGGLVDGWRAGNKTWGWVGGWESVSYWGRVSCSRELLSYTTHQALSLAILFVLLHGGECPLEMAAHLLDQRLSTSFNYLRTSLPSVHGMPIEMSPLPWTW